MNKAKQKLNILIFSIIIILSVTITPLAVVHLFLNSLTVSEEYSPRLSVKFDTEKGVHTPFVSINTVTGEGSLYVTMPRLLGDGSYGGDAGGVKRVTTYTQGLLYSLELEKGPHKIQLTARDGLNIKLNYVKIEV